MDNLLENNKLIAEFMGGTIEKLVKSSDTLFFVKDKICMGQPQWNIRYDWLMPVVKKINSLATEDNYNFNFYKILNLNIDASLNHIYESVVEFIKWYNENNKK